MVLAILQARVSSTRLPGKVLKPILGQPMILRQIERIKRAKKIDHLLVATSIDQTDDKLAGLCAENGIPCFRGNLEDVLDRFYEAAKPYNPDHVVRLTGDCPLADPQLVDQVIRFHLDGGFDYTSNTIEPTYPDGLDIEVLRFSCLDYAWREALLPSQREHVTPFIYQQHGRFKIGCYKNEIDLSRLRWTVDEPLDFELITKIYEAIYPINSGFTTQDILVFLDKHPELKTLNTHFQRNEGLLKSLQGDFQYQNALGKD
ncbi:MAG: glycosyltransferase family protein [Planctomycetes bacterium]|nr:glycosyltransferase family protein [Planctomycetota bacterium]